MELYIPDRVLPSEGEYLILDCGHKIKRRTDHEEEISQVYRVDDKLVCKACKEEHNRQYLVLDCGHTVKRKTTPDEEAPTVYQIDQKLYCQACKDTYLKETADKALEMLEQLHSRVMEKIAALRERGSARATDSTDDSELK